MDQESASVGNDKRIRRCRRVVTGHDALGRSILLSDTEAAHGPPFMGIEGFAVTDLWKSDAVPADNSPQTAEDPCAQPIPVAPPSGGVVFRVTQFPPESTYSARGSGPPNTAAKLPRHPHMHQTATLDFALVVEGEVWAVMEEGETLLRAGDVLIQRGTQHAWANRSDAPCVVAFTMIDAHPLAR